MAWLSRGERARCSRGAAAVEFALVMPILLMLVLGVIQYGLYFWGMQAGTSATSDAVRRITVGDCADEDDLKSFLKARIGSASPTEANAIVVDRTYKTASGGTATAPELGGSVTLTVTFSAMDLNFPLIPLPSDGSVTRQVFGRIEDTSATTGGCS